MDINNTMRQLAEYQRLQEETTAIIDGLKDELKRYMLDNNTDVIIGTEHKASYKDVISNRLDSKALKNDMPDIATKYTITTTTKRFTFN